MENECPYGFIAFSSFRFSVGIGSMFPAPLAHECSSTELKIVEFENVTDYNLALDRGIGFF